MHPKPVIYVLHGAWHSPQFFEPVKPRLEALGYTVICPQQRSTGAVPPTATLNDDATQVRDELDLLVENGEDVFLVMHSYGGMVGTEAAAGLGKAERSERGLKGGVMGLFYVCAFILPVGHHLCTALGGELAPFIKAKPDGSCNPIDPQHVFYNDLPSAEQEKWASKLQHHTVIAQKTPLTKAAYTQIPISYLYCENDQALPLWLQKAMVKQSGVQVHELTCTAGHSPFLSQPDVFIDRIEEAIMALEIHVSA